MRKILLFTLAIIVSLLSPMSGFTTNAEAAGTGLQWAPWSEISGTTTSPVASIEFTVNSTPMLFQAVVGSASPYWIYIRYTSDGLFDPKSCLALTQVQTNKECWDRVSVNGQSARQVSFAVHNFKLYLAIQGLDSKIYTKSMNALGVWDTNWSYGGGTTSNTVAQTRFLGKLYQAVRGNGSNRIFFRSSVDGVFDSGVGEQWIEVNGQTVDDISLAVHTNGFLYMTVRGSTGRIFTRRSGDGSTWSNWAEESSILAKTAPVLTVFKSKLYMSMTGYDDKIYVKSSADGTTWSSWDAAGGASPSRVETTTYQGRLVQTVRGASNKMYTRQTLAFSKALNFALMNVYEPIYNVTGAPLPYTFGFAYDNMTIGNTIANYLDSNAGASNLSCTKAQRTYIDASNYTPSNLATTPLTDPTKYNLTINVNRQCDAPASLPPANRTETYNVTGNVTFNVGVYTYSNNLYRIRAVWTAANGENIEIELINGYSAFTNLRSSADLPIMKTLMKDILTTFTPGNIG